MCFPCSNASKIIDPAASAGSRSIGGERGKRIKGGQRYDKEYCI